MIAATRNAQSGSTMIEVLVSMVISVIGLLGIAGFQLRAFSAENESFQRAQAVVLLNDMVHRINTNRVAAADYIGDDIGVGAIEDCTAAATPAQADLCAWGNLLRGSLENDGGNAVGGATAARGCITQVAPRTYIVAVVWEGIAASAAPATTCGQNSFSSEEMRRAVTATVVIGDLG